MTRKEQLGGWGAVHGVQTHPSASTLRMPQSSARDARPTPGVIVRGGAVSVPEPGGPPNNEDITSPNGFAFAVRGGGMSKYSVASSFSTYDSCIEAPLRKDVKSRFTHRSDFGLGNNTTAGLVCST
jgi:hypothetical protein